MKTHSVFTSKTTACLFPEQFDLWEDSDWNKDLPLFFKRLNKIEDDRSFVILATNALEYQIDRFLKVFIPKYIVLINDYTNLSKKIYIIEAFNLIPEQFPEMLHIIRNIRNGFAHNLEFDNFEDILAQRANNPKELKNLFKNIDLLEKKWNEFSNDMCYWSLNEPMRLMFKDIWRVCLEGLRVYEGNIKLFRQETEKKQFISELNQLSSELRKTREENERIKVRNYLRKK